MDKGVPLKYWIYRNVWSGIHVGLVLLGFGVVVYLFVQDGQGVRLTREFWSLLVEVEQKVSNAVHFPWNA